jgi:hypothetical protein
MHQTGTNPDRRKSSYCCFKTCKAVLRPAANFLAALSLLALAVTPGQLAAEEHLVPRQELRNQMLTAQQTREGQLHDIGKLLSSSAVQESLRSGGLDAQQVRDAVALLDDGELTRLADRARGIDSDLKAGALTNEHLTYIVIALATAVIVILAT